MRGRLRCRRTRPGIIVRSQLISGNENPSTTTATLHTLNRPHHGHKAKWRRSTTAVKQRFVRIVYTAPENKLIAEQKAARERLETVINQGAEQFLEGPEAKPPDVPATFS